jgi:hypothetical protein
MFGGERLYGNEKTVAVRELIQNSADAVRARQTLEESLGGREAGAIIVRLAERNGGYWLDIEDNGVGMSERTLTNTLLDFGNSFWAGDGVQVEFPGLMARGMSPTGKFGIGFFSVFMLGNVVRVTARRYDAAAGSARTLEFRGGLSLRPILRKATSEEVLLSGGTRVSVLLAVPPYDKGGLLADKDALGRVKKKDLGTVVAALCPSLDVAVFVVQDDQKVRVISPDDWRRIDGSKFLIRVDPSRGAEDVSDYAANLRPVVLNRVVYGRACIRVDPYWRASGRITVGGFTATNLRYLEGILLGHTDVLARDAASLRTPPAALALWADEQARIIARSKIPPHEQLLAAGVVIACGGNPQELPVAHMGGRYLSQRALDEVVRKVSSITVFEGEPRFDEDIDECLPREFKNLFDPATDVIFLGEVPGARYEKFWWPGIPSYKSILDQIVKRRWKKFEERAVENRGIGTVGDSEILRDVEVLTRLS